MTTMNSLILNYQKMLG